MVIADSKTPSERTVFVFVYGTLKKDFPNHSDLQEVITQNELTYIGTCMTHQPHPLIIGPYNTPYVLYLPGNGQQIKGELYSASARAVALLDELEETSVGHYERLPIQVMLEKKVDREDSEKGSLVSVLVDAEVYFAHRSFGEKMWEKSGRLGLTEYPDCVAKEYAMKKYNRPKVNSFLDNIEMFLSGSN